MSEEEAKRRKNNEMTGRNTAREVEGVMSPKNEQELEDQKARKRTHGQPEREGHRAPDDADTEEDEATEEGDEELNEPEMKPVADPQVLAEEAVNDRLLNQLPVRDLVTDDVDRQAPWRIGRRSDMMSNGQAVVEGQISPSLAQQGDKSPPHKPTRSALASEVLGPGAGTSAFIRQAPVAEDSAHSVDELAPWRAGRRNRRPASGAAPGEGQTAAGPSDGVPNSKAPDPRPILPTPRSVARPPQPLLSQSPPPQLGPCSLPVPPGPQPSQLAPTPQPVSSPPGALLPGALPRPILPRPTQPAPVPRVGGAVSAGSFPGSFLDQSPFTATLPFSSPVLDGAVPTINVSTPLLQVAPLEPLRLVPPLAQPLAAPFLPMPLPTPVAPALTMPVPALGAPPAGDELGALRGALENALRGHLQGLPDPRAAGPAAVDARFGAPPPQAALPAAPWRLATPPPPPAPAGADWRT